jgi:hypothetical protein
MGWAWAGRSAEGNDGLSEIDELAFILHLEEAHDVFVVGGGGDG